MARQSLIEHARKTRRADALVTCVLLILSIALLAYGWDFYRLDLDSRLDHDAYELLRPSGLVGHGYGMLGTLLILSNLMYLVRRRLARFERLGSMRRWLDVHVFTGLAGTALIIFHSAFQFRTPIAVATAVSLGLVAGTGVIGRYLYALTPAPDLVKLGSLIEELDEAVPGAAGALRAVLREHQPVAIDHHASLPRKLLSAPGWLRCARARKAALERTLDEFDAHPAVKALGPRLTNIAVEDALADGFTALLQSWRAFHRLLAILLLLLVPVHVGVAWMYGYRWIFQ